MTTACRERAKARLFVEKIGFEIVKRAMVVRQKSGKGNGDRPAPSLAARPVMLRELEEPALPDGKPGARITPLGYQTGTRAMPRILARLPPNDPRRMAAAKYADAVERLGASKGSDISGKSGGTAGVSDGGALQATRFAYLVRVAHAAVNGWDYHRGETSGDEWALLTPANRSLNERQPIRASVVLDAIAVEGRDVSHILEAHGWTPRAEYRKALQVKALEMLDELAVAIGFGRAV